MDSVILREGVGLLGGGRLATTGRGNWKEEDEKIYERREAG